MSTFTPQPHHDLISNALPAWYLSAPTALQQALQRDMVNGQKLREQLRQTLGAITPLDEFARPLLIKALDAEFGPGLDVDNTYYFKHIYTPNAFGELKLAAPELCMQTLLHAALQNFHEQEITRSDSTAKLQIVEIKRVQDARYGTYDQYPLHPMNVDPTRFMKVCRQLDLGGKYQAHLDAAVGAPSSVPGSPAAKTAAAVADLIGRKECNALRVQAHIAYLQKDISQAFYQHIVALDGRTTAGAVDVGCLRICGFSVRDILVFRVKGEKGCVVYVPNEPVNAMKAFDSFDSLKAFLSRRFTPAFCKTFMNRFIAQRSKSAFFHKVGKRIAPAHLRFDTQDSAVIPRLIHVREVASDFDLGIELEGIPYDLFTLFHFQHMLRIKDDARVLAVPTGDEDEESRRARLAGYISLGMNAVNFAALFVPLLGEVMMVVAGAQLLTEVFQGVGAWSHAEMDEALDHLGSVAENLAFMAAFGALVKTGAAPEIPPVKGSSFVGKMVPVKLPDGATRLWAPDLTPFAHDIVPPAGTQLTGEGLFTHQGKHYLPMDGKFYPVLHDATLNKWRIEPPHGERFSPALTHNGAGGWRHEGENPLSWDARTAFKRLSPEASALPEYMIEPVLRVTATDARALLELHLGNQPPASTLADAIRRFKVDDQVRLFQQQINDVNGFISADPQLQMELLTSMRRWPVGRPIQVVDAQGVTVAEYGAAVVQGRPDVSAGIRPLKVKQALIAEGKLLPTIIEGLGEAGQNRMFGRAMPRTAQNLAAEMVRQAEGRGSWLFDRLNQIQHASSDPQVNLIKRDFPTLSTAAAQELLTLATAEQLASMTATSRVPLEIAGRARGYAQEGRVYRALEGFCLASKADNPDTLKVSMGLLSDLPGWPEGMRLEVRDGSATGQLVESIGEPGATQRRVLIKRGQVWQASDALGNELGPQDGQRDNFFSAILHALPAASRRAMGFPDAIADAAPLRHQIINAAFQNRPRVSKLLQQWALKPRMRWPTRLADGRFGYELSGNGGLNPRFPFLEEVDNAERELMRVLRAMYPEVPDLQAYVSGRMISNGYNAQALLAFAQAEQLAYEPLRCALEGWVYAAEFDGAGQVVARRTIAEAISSGWRSNRPHSPLRYRPVVLESIDLAGLAGLPDMPLHFSDITRITLRNVTATEAQMSRFLQLFSGMTRLEIVGGGMSRVPNGLAGLTQLEELSFEGMGLTIDQAAMDQFMNMPHLSILDLSGNTLGVLTDTSRLQVSRLYLANMQLTQWPDWTNTLNLSVLDVSNNQIEHLPQHLIRNEQGAYFRTTVYGNANPFNHEELLECWLNQRHSNIYELEYDYPDSIRELARTPSGSEAESEYYSSSSSDNDGDWHSHDFDQSPPTAPVPSVDIWIVEGRTELNSRIRSAWERVEQVNDAPNLLILLERLRETRDFSRVHEELAGDVMRVLEAAAQDTQLRGELEVMANDRLFGPDQTCQDGARLIFSDIQVVVYARAALQGVPEAQQTEALFGVIRSLFRLNEVQTIADLDIADREARGLHVDHAEVRLAYRIGLANELNLPAQPVNMVWGRLAAVERRAILDARLLILQRETGPEFLEYALADRRWNERLRVEYRTDLARITAPIRAEQEALLEHPPLDTNENLHRHSAIYERLDAAHAANDPAALAAANRDLQELTANPPVDNDEFDRQGRALIARLEAAEKAFLAQMTNSLRQNW